MSVAELNNKIVFITGGGAGIGLKSVNAFADASCTVIANEVLRGDSGENDPASSGLKASYVLR